MFSILSKEINLFLQSLIGYIVYIVFLSILGLFMWVFPETNVLNYGFSEMETLFFITPWVFLFLIPAITMRMFAEEKRNGTLELLFTRPLTDWDIILGKYFASVVLVFIALIPTLVYYFSIYTLGNPVGNIDSAAVVGSYIGLFLLGVVFCSIGILASSITDNQIVAFILAVFMSFIIHSGFASLASIDVWGDISFLISKLGIAYHYTAISKGLIDSRDVLYFLSVITIMLSASKLVLSSRNW